MTRGVTPDMVANILGGATPREEVRQRQGPGGKMLDYVDARYVMGKLDQLGPENWRTECPVMAGPKVAAGISILIAYEDGTSEWVTRWDGAGETDIEGEKGSFSDAFKRAAVHWGIARDLYPTPHQAAPARRPAQSSPAAASSSAAVGEDPDAEAWEKAKAHVSGAPQLDAHCEQHPGGGTWRQNDKGGYWHGPKGIVVKDDGTPTYHSWWPPREPKR